MNNNAVERELDKCATDLSHVTTIVSSLGISSAIVPYLTKFAIIRACGAIEQAFKTVIADYCAKRSKRQVKNYLTRKVRDCSANPSFSNLCSFLGDFDAAWKDGFKAQLRSEADESRLKDSLQSLVDARNDFAHGGNPSASLTDVTNYFADARRLIEVMDDVIG